MIELFIAILLFIILLFFKNKEGFEGENLVLAEKYIKDSLKNPRINNKQKIALEDALRYVTFIKNIEPI
jgi:hypothetical protein